MQAQNDDDESQIQQLKIDLDEMTKLKEKYKCEGIQYQQEITELQNKNYDLTQQNVIMDNTIKYKFNCLHLNFERSLP